MWGALVSLTVAASLFWGLLFAGFLKYVFDLSQEQTRIAFVPAAIAVAAFCYLVRHKLARATGFDYY
jgi:hypothetical protein